MKRLTLSVLVLALAAGSGMALADRDRDRGHGGHRGGDGHGYKHHGYKHGHHRGHWYPRPYQRRVYYYSRHDHRSDYNYPLGAALIGAAVTYSLYHGHDDGYSGRVGSNQVVGCHRIERYPGGSERRVEVPLEECY